MPPPPRAARAVRPPAGSASPAPAAAQAPAHAVGLDGQDAAGDPAAAHPHPAPSGPLAEVANAPGDAARRGMNGVRAAPPRRPARCGRCRPAGRRRGRCRGSAGRTRAPSPRPRRTSRSVSRTAHQRAPAQPRARRGASAPSKAGGRRGLGKKTPAHLPAAGGHRPPRKKRSNARRGTRARVRAEHRVAGGRRHHELRPREPRGHAPGVLHRRAQVVLAREQQHGHVRERGAGRRRCRAGHGPAAAEGRSGRCPAPWRGRRAGSRAVGPAGHRAAGRRGGDGGVGRRVAGPGKRVS